MSSINQAESHIKHVLYHPLEKKKGLTAIQLEKKGERNPPTRAAVPTETSLESSSAAFRLICPAE